MTSSAVKKVTGLRQEGRNQRRRVQLRRESGKSERGRTEKHDKKIIGDKMENEGRNEKL